MKAKIKAKDGKVTEGDFSHVIVAVGIVPNTENIGLETLGIKAERGIIAIDGYGRTNVKGVWAIGDCTPGPWLAHKASHEGVIAAEAIAAELGNKDVHPHPMDRNNIPGCTYCHPQIASVGHDRGEGQGSGLRGQGRAPSRSSATARRSRWARPRASSRPCSTPRPANCSART